MTGNWQVTPCVYASWDILNRELVSLLWLRPSGSQCGCSDLVREGQGVEGANVSPGLIGPILVLIRQD